MLELIFQIESQPNTSHIQQQKGSSLLASNFEWPISSLTLPRMSIFEHSDHIEEIKWTLMVVIRLSISQATVYDPWIAKFIEIPPSTEAALIPGKTLQIRRAFRALDRSLQRRIVLISTLQHAPSKAIVFFDLH